MQSPNVLLNSFLFFSLEHNATSGKDIVLLVSSSICRHQRTHVHVMQRQRVRELASVAR